MAIVSSTISPKEAHAGDHTTRWADCDDLRTAFTLAMSAMYKTEVALYEDLVKIVAQVNASALKQTMDPKVLNMRIGDASPSRLDIERHGAIRLGTPHELRTIRAVFGLLGLHAVGYYDLSEAGLPMHATCFRPIGKDALRNNPFRVFTSVLRPDLIRDGEAREISQVLLAKRNIFSDELMGLLGVARSQGGRLMPDQGALFIQEALKTFQWQGVSTATPSQYARLHAVHPILPDVTCFATSHINHLTPRSLDITATQLSMVRQGLRVKESIEGPPPRACPVLLRQTSFLAIEEQITFHGHSSCKPEQLQTRGSHRARFGEVEERGAAVTTTGRALYDKLISQANSAMAARSSANGSRGSAQGSWDGVLKEAFQEYPDDWAELRRQGLVHFMYSCVGSFASASISEEHRVRDQQGPHQPTACSHSAQSSLSLEALLRDGILQAVPITYEDFLPLSAAGIFQSNLGSAPSASAGAVTAFGNPDQEGMEAILGVPILDPSELYRKMEEESIAQCAAQLGANIAR